MFFLAAVSQAAVVPHDVPLVSIAPKGKETVLSAGRLWGRLLDNRANHERQGSGFNPLVHLDRPKQPIFGLDGTGLNFEHIFDGAAAHADIAMFTPRNDPVELTVQSDRCATLHWPAAGNAWRIASTMTYSFTAPDTIDMTFRTTPTEDRFPLDYVCYMWASYLACARDRKIHFLGLENGEEGWTSFGHTLADGKIETGTVAYAHTDPLAYEPGAQALNIVESNTKQFREPFYYGVLENGENESSEGILAYIMMFDQSASIRFAMWNFAQDKNGGPDTHRPAWDWQFVIRRPEPGRTYGYRARLVIRRVSGRDDIATLYRDWTASLASNHNQDATRPYRCGLTRKGDLYASPLQRHPRNEF
jgi:hypothetical protein